MFAANRIGATKVCLTDYTDGAFGWFAVAAQRDIPEDVYLEVLGSRKPVLFVEGTSGSLDLGIYQMAYPQFTVKSVGGCASVLAATKAFRSLRNMHHLECYGIVDRDYLEQGQLEAYERRGVFAPLVAEVENLYLVPNVIQAVADQLLLDGRTILGNVQNYILAEFQRGVLSHSLDVTRYKVGLEIGRFSSGEPTIDQFSAQLRSHMGSIDPKAIYDAALAEANGFLASADYESILRVFNRKDLVTNVGRFFDIKKGTYIDKVGEMAKRGIGDIPAHLMKFLPDVASRLPKQEIEQPIGTGPIQTADA
jgi:hypothetical protein